MYLHTSKSHKITRHYHLESHEYSYTSGVPGRFGPRKAARAAHVRVRPWIIEESLTDFLPYIASGIDIQCVRL